MKWNVETSLLFVARIIWRPAVLGRARDFGWLWNSLPSLAPRICLTVVWSPWWHIENQADALERTNAGLECSPVYEPLD